MAATAMSAHAQAVDELATAEIKEIVPAVQFQYTALLQTLPSYTFLINDDGTGSFTEKVAGPDGAVGESRARLAISAKTMTAILAGTRVVEKGGFLCAAKMKGIADTGQKVLRVGGSNCTYNYSTDKTVVELTDTFQAMAFTLDEGRKLAFKHRYDRLGLNDEMMHLVDAVKAGRAIELGNIAEVLNGLVEDGDVLERVRTRAAELLKAN